MQVDPQHLTGEAVVAVVQDALDSLRAERDEARDLLREVITGDPALPEDLVGRIRAVTGP